jgi:hypothetical protein
MEPETMGGRGKAEGFADGGWANRRQAALAAATQPRRHVPYHRFVVDETMSIIGTDVRAGASQKSMGM